MYIVKKVFEYNEVKYKDYYYLVLRSQYNKKRIEDILKDKVIDGITSISRSEKIINAFFDIRPLLLLLPKNETRKINNLHEVDYLDIDYLCNDNFKLLRRIYDVDETYNLSSLLYQVFQRLDVKNKNKNTYISNLYNHIIKNNQMKQILFLIKDVNLKISDDEYNEVTNFNELVNIYYKKILDIEDISYALENVRKPILVEEDLFRKNLTIEQVKYVTKYIILNFSTLFEKEGEVLVLDNKLKIPDSTIVFVKNSKYDNIKVDVLAEVFDKIIPIIHHKDTYIKIRNIDKIVK